MDQCSITDCLQCSTAAQGDESRLLEGCTVGLCRANLAHSRAGRNVCRPYLVQAVGNAVVGERVPQYGTAHHMVCPNKAHADVPLTETADGQPEQVTTAVLTTPAP